MTTSTGSKALTDGARLVDLLIHANNLDQWKDSSFARALADALILALTEDQLSAFMVELEKVGVSA